MSANISIKIEDDLAVKILTDIADNLDNAKSGRDYGEMSSEDAYRDAISAVSMAIQDAIKKHSKNPSG